MLTIKHHTLGATPTAFTSTLAALAAAGLTLAAIAYGSVRQKHDRRRR